MKKVVSDGPARAIAFLRADDGLPDTIFLIIGICRPEGLARVRWVRRCSVVEPTMHHRSASLLGA